MFLPAVREFPVRGGRSYQLASDIKGFEVGSGHCFVFKHRYPLAAGGYRSVPA